MTRRAAITGIGVVLPETQTVAELWSRQMSGVSPIRPLSDRLRGSVVDEGGVSAAIAPRLSRKLDSFTRYALVAVQRAIDHAGLDMERLDRERCGVFVGNCFGGWRFTEAELRHLHREGPRAVSPFQATSWFPAAPQGQITISHGVKGFSKTFMADRASSLLSVAAAARMIEQGKLDAAIAGGVESTNTDFIRTAIEKLADEGDPSSPEGGFTVSEGAVFLILEEVESAARRGATVYAVIGGFAMSNAPCEADRYGADPEPMIRAMRRALGNRRPTIVMPDACGLGGPDRAEDRALSEVCGGSSLAIPKQKYGHSFGAEGAVDIAYASLMLERQQKLPAPARTEAALSTPGQAVAQAQRTRIDSILINARAAGGAASSLLLTARSL